MAGRKVVEAPPEPAPSTDPTVIDAAVMQMLNDLSSPMGSPGPSSVAPLVASPQVMEDPGSEFLALAQSYADGTIADVADIAEQLSGGISGIEIGGISSGGVGGAGFDGVPSQGVGGKGKGKAVMRPGDGEDMVLV